MASVKLNGTSPLFKGIDGERQERQEREERKEREEREERERKREERRNILEFEFN
jgi:hypothetical protein